MRRSAITSIQSSFMLRRPTVVRRDEDVPDGRPAVSSQRDRELNGSVGTHDSGSVGDGFRTTQRDIDIVEKDENVALRHLVEETQPGHVVGLMDADDHYGAPHQSGADP